MKHHHSTEEIAAYRIHPKSFLFSFVMVLVIILIGPLIAQGFVGGVFVQGCFYVLILLTMNTLSHNRRMLYVSFALAIPILIGDITGIYFNSLGLLIIGQLFLTSFLIFSIYFIVLQVLKEPVIDTNLIFGAIMVYLISGVVWSKFYWIASVFIPNSFKGIDPLSFQDPDIQNVISTQFDLFYYSFTTLATLGLGDISPIHRFVKSLTLLQAIYGQLFVAITIAKMVSAWRPSSQIIKPKHLTYFVKTDKKED